MQNGISHEQPPRAASRPAAAVETVSSARSVHVVDGAVRADTVNTTVSARHSVRSKHKIEENYYPYEDGEERNNEDDEKEGEWYGYEEVGENDTEFAEDDEEEQDEDLDDDSGSVQLQNGAGLERRTPSNKLESSTLSSPSPVHSSRQISTSDSERRRLKRKARMRLAESRALVEEKRRLAELEVKQQETERRYLEAMVKMERMQAVHRQEIKRCADASLFSTCSQRDVITQRSLLWLTKSRLRLLVSLVHQNET